MTCHTVEQWYTQSC